MVLTLLPVTGEMSEQELGVFERSISELKLEAVETVIELIEGNNLYRGAEFLKSLEEQPGWYLDLACPLMFMERVTILKSLG